MASFNLELPTDIMKDIQFLYQNSDEIFGNMTKAGAEVAMKNIKASVPKSFHNSEIMRCLKMTRVYKTPSDKGINTKVGFYGYFKNENGKIVPAPLICNKYEYGRSSSPFPKHPFMRKSFNKGAIEKAMMDAQKRLSGGLLDE